jgi:hypothetical protein
MITKEWRISLTSRARRWEICSGEIGRGDSGCLERCVKQVRQGAAQFWAHFPGLLLTCSRNLSVATRNT